MKKPIQKYPMFSVVIPMYNAENTIQLCLQSIKSTEYPSDKLEIIVVNDGSTDRSVELTEKFEVKLIQNNGNTIASVRNTGAKIAKGEIIGFIDSDCVIDRMWMKNAVSILRDKNVAATGSGYLCPENPTWVERAWLYESKHIPFYTEFITSGNFIIKSEVFKTIGGYNEKLTTCEDSDICSRIVANGYRIINSSDIKVVHLGNPKTIVEFIKKELWYGEGMLGVGVKYFKDKVLMATCLFSLIHLVAVVSLISLIINFDLKFLIFSIASVICLVLFSALYRVKRSKKYSLLFQTTILYYFYYFARSVAVIKIILGSIKVSHNDD